MNSSVFMMKGMIIIMGLIFGTCYKSHRQVDGGDIDIEVDQIDVGVDDSGVTSTELFAMSYGGRDFDSGVAVLETRDGGFLVIGRTFSFGDNVEPWIVKFNARGDIEWQKVYRGDGRIVVEPVNLFETEDGGFLVFGNVTDWGWSYILIMKLNSSGNIEWQKVIRDNTQRISVSVIRKTADRGYILGGSGTREVGDDFVDNVLVLKLNEELEIEWQQNYLSQRFVSILDIVEIENSGFIVAWSTGGRGLDLPHENNLVKLDQMGNIEWKQRYDVIIHGYIVDITKSSDGGFAVLGQVYLPDGRFLFFVIKHRGDSGEIEWQKAYVSWEILAPEVNQIIDTPDGGFIVVGGFTELPIGGIEDIYDIWLTKLTRDGEIEWQKSYGGEEANEGAFNVIITRDGKIVIVGLTYSYDGGGRGDVWFLKMDSTGVISPACPQGIGEIVEVSVVEDIELSLYNIELDFIEDTNIESFFEWLLSTVTSTEITPQFQCTFP